MVYAKETDHPYSMKDPRNQFVNFNLKYKDANLNKVKTHYKTTYNRSYSPKRSISAKRNN